MDSDQQCEIVIIGSDQQGEAVIAVSDQQCVLKVHYYVRLGTVICS